MLPETQQVSAMMPTVEGDTIVLAKQNTNYIFNKIKDLAKGGTVPDLFKYLG